MNLLSNERGFAMIEAVLAIAVIGILATIVIPKLDRALDEVYVDYEIRGLHSLAHYTQSVSRISNYKPFGFSAPLGFAPKYIELAVFTGENKLNYYCVREYQKTERLKENHMLERNFHLLLSNLDSSIRFRSDGSLSSSGGNITLRKGNVVRYLVLTHYGRMRISRTPP